MNETKPRLFEELEQEVGGRRRRNRRYRPIAEIYAATLASGSMTERSS